MSEKSAGPVVHGHLSAGDRVRPKGSGIKGTVDSVRRAQAIVHLDNGLRVRTSVRELVVL